MTVQHLIGVWINIGLLILCFTLVIMPPDRRTAVGTYPWSIIIVGFIGVVLMWPAFVLGTMSYAYRLIRDAHRNKGP